MCLLDQRSSTTSWRISGDGVGDVVVVHQLQTLLEDHLALIVHHVVVFEDVLADVEVARLDLALGVLDRLVHPGMGDRLAVLRGRASAAWRPCARSEDAHQVVLQRQEELGAARVALTAGAAAQLVVDAPAFVALGAEHIQPAGGERLFLQLWRSRR